MIELWVGFGVLILGTIFGIVSYFLKRMIEGFDKKIDLIDSKIEFLIIGKKTNDKDIENIQKDIVVIYDEVEKVHTKYDELHTRLTRIETQHEGHHNVS